MVREDSKSRQISFATLLKVTKVEGEKRTLMFSRKDGKKEKRIIIQCRSNSDVELLSYLLGCLAENRNFDNQRRFPSIILRSGYLDRLVVDKSGNKSEPYYFILVPSRLYVFKDENKMRVQTHILPIVCPRPGEAAMDAAVREGCALEVSSNVIRIWIDGGRERFEVRADSADYIMKWRAAIVEAIYYPHLSFDA
mmetsp:Transcript_49661/g.127679  ORF Transcript_49661/g.127679 Transcript_49661/m.127679 type:complete len:195 (-) Transcript_49661:233-817(-)